MEHAAENNALQLGPLHPRTLAARAGLGAAYAYVGRLDDAFTILREVASASRSTLGLEHRQTLSVELNLATLESELGRIGEARARLEAAHGVAVVHLGANHSETLGIAYSLGRLRLHSGDVFGAEDVLCRAADAAMAVQGPSSWTAWLASVQWCEALVVLGRGGDARAVLSEAAPALESLLGPDHEHTRWAELLFAQARELDS